jgi:hypothetical protein
MQKILIAAYLMVSTNLIAEENLSNLKIPDLLEFKNHIRETNKKSQWKDGLVVLFNGTKKLGKFSETPSIQYSFGKLIFNIEDIAIIAFSEENNHKNLHLLTRDGYHYKSDILNQKFINIEENKTSSGEQDAIHFILVNDLDENSHKEKNIFTLYTKNGDFFPVSLEPRPITLGNGFNEISILPSSMIFLANDDEIHLRTKNQKGYEDNHYSTIKDENLSFSIPQSDCTYKMPWKNVQKIEKENFSKTHHFYSSLLEEIKILDKPKVSSIVLDGDQVTLLEKVHKDQLKTSENVAHSSKPTIREESDSDDDDVEYLDEDEDGENCKEDSLISIEENSYDAVNARRFLEEHPIEQE